MSTQTKKPSIYNQTDKSDVLSLLQSIESMYMTCQNVLNIYTQTTLMLSITIEAQMLLMKLGVMKERWQSHLPFKEACMVDFYDWSKRVEEMSMGLVGIDENGDSVRLYAEYCPSKHFMLDLYEKLPEGPSSNGSPAYYEELNIPKFIAIQDKIRKQITKHWKAYKIKFSDMIAQKVDERIGDVLQPLADKGVRIRMNCCDVLQQLSVELYQLYAMPPGVIQRDQFARLAERVINEPEYGGNKAQQLARRDVDNLKNVTPEEEREERRDGEIKASIEIISEMKYGRRVINYTNRNYDIKNGYSGLGKFLNSIRRDISKEELSDLMEQLYRIRFLREDMEQQEVIKAEMPVTPEHSTAKDADAVYRKRKAAQPQKPLLPKFFNEKLASNETAVDCFYETLHHCGFFIGRTLLANEKNDSEQRRYEGWKWSHLREAFVKLDFFKADSSKKGFALFLADVFPYLSATNIQRGFNSRGGYVDTNATRRIIKEIMDEFEDVVDVMNRVTKK